MSSDARGSSAAFRAFEQAGWESNVAEYDSAFVRLTSQAIEPLLDAAAVGPGKRVLDVATGPGQTAAAAAARGAQVTAIDFSGPMVALARRRYPHVDFREGDAEALDFEDGAFDALFMAYGILHLARPEQAMGEAARVLRPGGRFAFTVWAKPEEALGFGMVLSALQAHGRLDVDVPEGPSFFRFSEPAECERTLRAAGFRDVRVAQVPQVWRFNGDEGPLEAISRAGVRVGAILRAQSHAALAAMRVAVHEACAKHRHGATLEIPMPAVLATGTR